MEERQIWKQELGDGEDRLLRQNRVLVELALSRTAREAGFDAAVQEITRAAAETIGSERVSVWVYNRDRSAILCADLYEHSTGRHSQGMELAADRYPSYFAALETERTIAAHDARIDPRTREFKDDYLTPLGITSMLDAPIRVGGQMIGVVCHEHVGPARQWTEDEQSFAGSIADAVSLAYEEIERQRAEAEREEILARERAARAEAEAANRIKDEFLATVSHELRTPLNAMVGWIHLVRAGGLDAATTDRALATIERNIRAQAQIIDDILDVSRIIRGSLALNVQPVDLAAVLHQVVDSLRPAAQSKGIGVHTTVDPTVGPVNGDPDRMQQVVWNLLSNAIKFTPAGGKVEAKLERQGAGIRLLVADTGQGIAPEFLPHVFEYFRQADSSTTRAHGGLGLGLAIVRHLVELHGGTVTAESAGENQGARFTVMLPATVPVPAPLESPVKEPSPDDRTGSPLAGRRLLVVDDDPDTREAVGFLLLRAGAVVETVSSAREALAAIERSRPDVLIADIGMPGEDGYELIRQVRTLPPERGGRIPAIALTAYARPEDRERALAVGYQEHVAKPVEPEALIELLRELV